MLSLCYNDIFNMLGYIKYFIKVISPTYCFLEFLENLLPVCLSHFYWTLLLQIGFLQTLQLLFASFTHSVSSSHRNFAHTVPAFLPLLFFAQLTPTHLSALSSSLISSRKISMTPLAWFNSLIISFHATVNLTLVAFIPVAILLLCTYQLSPFSIQLSCGFHESRDHICFCSAFSFQCLAQCLA